MSDGLTKATPARPRPRALAAPRGRFRGRRLPGSAALGATGRSNGSARCPRDRATLARVGIGRGDRRCKRALLVTYRRDGTPVPTPVWAAAADGRSVRALGAQLGQGQAAASRPAPAARPVHRAGQAARGAAGGERAGARPARRSRRRAGAGDALRTRARAVRARDGSDARGHVLPGDHARGVGGSALRRPARGRRGARGASASRLPTNEGGAIAR